MMTKKLLSGVLFLLLVSLISTLQAQIVSSDSVARGTLSGWVQTTQNLILNQSNNYGGVHYNRGLFRQHLNEMSPEFDIDYLTYQFDMIDDYQWYQQTNGFRTAIGSFNALEFLAISHMKQSLDWNNNTHQFDIDVYSEDYLKAERAFLILNYTYKISQHHGVGAFHTADNTKYDLDGGLYYTFKHPLAGEIKTTFTAIDYATNKVMSLARGSDNRYNDDYPILHRYDRNPYLLEISWKSPDYGPFRAEFFAGNRTPLKKTVTPRDNNESFIDTERAHYIGALIDGGWQRATIGITYQRRYSHLRRIPAPDSDYTFDFTNLHWFDRLGIYSQIRWKPLTWKHFMWYEYQVDELRGKEVPDDLRPPIYNPIQQPFDLREQRLKIQSTLQYRVTAWTTTFGLTYSGDFRDPQGDIKNGIWDLDFRQVYPIVRDRNERLTFRIDHDFNPQFRLTLGFSLDLDGDNQSGYGAPKIVPSNTVTDGGFGRMTISW